MFCKVNNFNLTQRKDILDSLRANQGFAANKFHSSFICFIVFQLYDDCKGVEVHFKQIGNHSRKHPSACFLSSSGLGPEQELIRRLSCWRISVQPVFLGGCCILCPEMSSNVVMENSPPGTLIIFPATKNNLMGDFCGQKCPKSPDRAWATWVAMAKRWSCCFKEGFCFPVLPLNILNMSELIYCTSSYLYLPLSTSVIHCYPLFIQKTWRN